MQDTATNENIGAVQCVKCKIILRYCATKTGCSHLKRHSCKIIVGQSSIDKHFPQPSSIHISQNIKEDEIKACVAMCCKNIRPFDIVKVLVF